MPLGEQQPHHEAVRIPWPSQDQLKRSRSLEAFEAALDPTVPRRVLIYCMRYLVGHAKHSVVFVHDVGPQREEHIDLYQLVLWRLERKGHVNKRNQISALPPGELSFLVDTILKKELMPKAREYRDRAVKLLEGEGYAYFSPTQARTTRELLLTGGYIDASLWDLLQEVMYADAMRNRQDYFARPNSTLDDLGGHSGPRDTNGEFGDHDGADQD